MNQEQLNKIRVAAGLPPVYKRDERKHLEEKAQKKSDENKALTEAANNRAPLNVITDIARRHLNIRTLKAQNNDSADFHEVSVWGVENALKAAFKAGQDSAKSSRPVKEGDESKEEAKVGGSDYDPKGGERYPADDSCDPTEKKSVEKPKAGKSAEGYKTPKNKSAKQVAEAKADKDHDGDGKVESSEEEHRGAKDKAIKAAMKKHAKYYKGMDKSHKEAMTGKKDDVDESWDLEKAKKGSAEYKKKHGVEAKGSIKKAADKKKVTEMDLELELPDEEGASDMKSRRMELIRRAADKVRGGGDVVDVGEPMDDEGSAMADMDAPVGDEYDGEYDNPEAELSGDMDFGGGDFEWGEEDCEMAVGSFQPEDEEAFATGFDAFRKGMPEDDDRPDWRNGYETARFTRMASVAEGSSEGYSNPKGNKLKADPKSGTSDKYGKKCTTTHHKDDSRSAKSEDKGAKGLKKISETEDATVFDKDYHHPAGANGHLDMAQHKGEPHVQGRGQEEAVKVPVGLKTSLKEEINALIEDAGKVRYRDEYRADFYEATAEAFKLLLAHLEEGTKHSLLLAQIDLNRVMSPMTERLPRDVYMYIVRGGKPASLNELFREVKVKADKGADLSKEDYTK